MKAIWDWFRGPFWEFVKSHWKLVVVVATVLFSLWTGRKLRMTIENVVKPPKSKPVTVAGGKAKTRRNHAPL